jgi:hypothetical protein
MDEKAIDQITRQVSRQFPEMAGVRPSLRRQPPDKKGSQGYLLTYKSQVALPGGNKISRIVRVVADESGHVIRISTSR